MLSWLIQTKWKKNSSSVKLFFRFVQKDLIFKKLGKVLFFFRSKNPEKRCVHLPNSKHTFNGNLFLPKRTAHYLSLPCALETSLPNRTLWKKGKSAGKSHSSTTGYSGCTILWMAKKSIPIFSSKTSLKWTKTAFWSKNRVATTFKRWKTEVVCFNL